MKKLWLIALCFVCTEAIAETIEAATQTTNKKRKGYKKYRTAKQFFQKEDETDSAYIYHNLGWDAYKTEDFGAARWYWERGANCASNIPSKYNCAFRLGLLNQMGEGVGVNYEVAYYYYNIAYANGQKIGNVDATKNIASYFENGMGVGQDYKQALAWYLKAKAQGNKYCDDDIKRCREKLREMQQQK